MLINLQKPNNTPESLPSDKIEHQVERNFIKKKRVPQPRLIYEETSTAHTRP
jgi:hypothetical protein